MSFSQRAYIYLFQHIGVWWSIFAEWNPSGLSLYSLQEENVSLEAGTPDSVDKFQDASNVRFVKLQKN